MKQMKHWQDPVSALLGAWLVISPWVLGFVGSTTAMVNSVVIGLALIAAAMGAILMPRAWEEWTEAVLGLWMMVSPWLLSYYQGQTATSNALITGLAVLALSLWVLMTDKDYGGWLSDKTA